MSLSNLKLGTKLSLLAGTGLVASGLIAATAFYGIRSISASEVALAEDALPSQVLIGEINDDADNLRMAQMQIVLVAGTPRAAEFDKEFESLQAGLPKLLSDYEKRIDGDEERKLHAAMAKAIADFTASAQATNAQVRSGDAAQIEKARADAAGRSSLAFVAVGEAIDALGKFNDKAVDTAHADAKRTSAFAQGLLLGILALAGLALAGFAVWLTRHLVRQIGGEPVTAMALARSVAEGDLSAPISLRAGDRTSLMASLRDMQANLAKVVAGVRQNAEGVATGSVQIAQGNNDLSGRTEEQASALEETAASMEELGSTVKQNADNARQANQLALGATGVAQRGGEVVGQVVDTMKGINDSSKKIAEIIGVIDGIAFQTNILALNAAVEAARAGEQGRGFAVVAGEVRNLAQRSAEAAKEIKSLITVSVERVEQGSVLVDQAGTTMTEIVAAIQRVTDIMGEISAASSEQSAGVAQVGEAITQMDQATQQNAALVEESAAAAESLKVQAAQLVSAVSVFRLAAGTDVTFQPAPAPAARTAPAAKPWVGQERRGPDRARNVVRLAPAPAPMADNAARNGTNAWEAF